MARKMISSLFQSSGDSDAARRGPRVTPDPLLTIRLPVGNQGIVLDLSEEGLGFLAASPIDEGRSLRFVLADRSNKRTEATGQLMWKDAAGKRCGLQFTQVSMELRALIQSYLGQEGSDAMGANEPLPPGFDIPDSFPSQIHAGIGLPEMEMKRPRKWNFAANATTIVAAILVAATIWYNIGGQRKVISLESVKRHVVAFVFTKMNRIPSGWTAKLNLHPALTTEPKQKSVAAVPAAVANTPQPESAAEANVTTTSGAQAPEPAIEKVQEPIAAAQAAPSIKMAAKVTAEPTTKPATEPAAKATIKPGTGAAAQTVEEISSHPEKNEPAETRPPELHTVAAPVEQTDEQVAAARKLLTKQDDPANQSKGVQLLWQAVAKGNPAAEVELATLYLSGTGVSKSCSQALVLLKAAESRKSATAQQKLAELPQFGCAASGNNATASMRPAVDSEQQ
jgi:hypothetical protein